ncbi:MAG: FAD-dependent oxidoreductase [Pseudomonadota bacterium]
MTLDVAVIGAGIMGLAAARSLAKSGANVTVFEAAPRFCGAQGGSRGKARVTRLTYGHEDYCNLAKWAYTAWDSLGETFGEPLYRKVGGLDISLSRIGALDAYCSALNSANIPFEIWDAQTTQAKFPNIALPEGAVALFQEDTAVLHADLCAAALEQEARTAGATVNYGAKVTDVRPVEASVELATEHGHHRFDRVVICAGAEMQSWAETLGTPLNLQFSREQVSYFSARDRDAHHADNMPILIFHLGDNVLSSVFPILRDDPVKAMVENNGRVTASVEELNRIKVGELQEFILPNLPRLEPDPAETDTCHYILTQDNDFVVDRLPNAPNVVVCSACSGHGFKFAPVLGDLMRDLALSDEKAVPRFAIDFAMRPGLAP